MTTTFNLPLLQIQMNPAAVTFDQPTPPTATPAGHQTNYALIAVDQTGRRHAEFPQAVITQCTWELNGIGQASFSIPTNDPHIDQLPLANGGLTPVREVQIWRNGHLIWWGVPTKRRVDNSSGSNAGLWQYTAESLLWYFKRRYIGMANRHNFLTNGSAEDGTTVPWVPHSTTIANVFSHPVLGNECFRLTGGGAQAYMSQFQLITSTGIGLALFLSAYVWVDSASFTTMSFLAKSASLLRYTPGNATPIQESNATQPMNNRIPKDKWVRVAAVISIPPNLTEVIEVRLWEPPGCTVFWDAVELVVEESVAFGGPPPDNGPWDQVAIAKEVVRYAQGQGFFSNQFGTPNGKSDLNIGIAGAPSGHPRYRIYFMSEHQKIYEGGAGNGVLDEWPSREAGFDFDIQITPTSRTFTTYYPHKGSTRDGLALEWGRNVSSYTIEESIENAANQIVELGSDTGSATSSADPHHTSREEGGYSNPSSLGGLTLELVEHAPTSTPIDGLDGHATARGHALEQGVVIPNLTVYDVRDDDGTTLLPIIGVIDVGDIVPVRIDNGSVQVNDHYRIVHMALDPQTDTMQVATNLQDIQP